MFCEQLMSNGCCKVASTISEVWCKPTPHQCTACTNHVSSPQRVNSVTCAIGYNEQKKRGLEPNSKLLDCVNNDRLEVNEELALAGRKAWEKLHTFNPRYWEPSLVEGWVLEAWVLQIPKFSCDCKGEFDDYVFKHPVDAQNVHTYRYWTFNFHNHIREKLFQPTLSLGEACDLWDWDVMKLLIL